MNQHEGLEGDGPVLGLVESAGEGVYAGGDESAGVAGQAEDLPDVPLLCRVLFMPGSFDNGDVEIGEGVAAADFRKPYARRVLHSSKSSSDLAWRHRSYNCLKLSNIDPTEQRKSSEQRNVGKRKEGRKEGKKKPPPVLQNHLPSECSSYCFETLTCMSLAHATYSVRYEILFFLSLSPQLIKNKKKEREKKKGSLGIN